MLEGQKYSCMSINMPSSVYGVSNSGHIRKWDNQGSIPGHSYMWTFARVLAPGQQYNCWTYTTTNPSMGVLAKNAGRDLKLDLLIGAALKNFPPQKPKNS
jgi:hypothetical protein